MSRTLSSAPTLLGAEAAESRFALRLAAALTEHQVGAANRDIDARLGFAHDQAMAAARKSRSVAVTVPSIIDITGGTAVLGGGPGSGSTPWWLRLGALVPLAVLLAGLMLIDSQYTRSQIDAAAEVDAAILSDDVPPEAYRDRGFVEFLKTARP